MKAVELVEVTSEAEVVIKFRSVADADIALAGLVQWYIGELQELTAASRYDEAKESIQDRKDVEKVRDSIFETVGL